MCHHYLGYGGGAGANPGDETPGKRRPAGCGDPRNPFLLKYMENLRYVDRLGRGFPMIIRQMKNLAGKEPGLEEKGKEFWLTLYLQNGVAAAQDRRPGRSARYHIPFRRKTFSNRWHRDKLILQRSFAGTRLVETAP